VVATSPAGELAVERAVRTLTLGGEEPALPAGPAGRGAARILALSAGQGGRPQCAAA
jgi:hypothetical protein